MNRLRKTDYFIIAVLLALIAFIAFMVTRGGKTDTPKTANNNAAPAVVSETPRTLTVKDYAGKKIGVQTGTVFDKMIEENIPNAEISYYNSYTDMLSALKVGKIDGFAADEPMVKYMMTEDSAVDYLKDYMDDYSFGFAFGKSAKGEALCNEFSEYIKKIRSDGTLAEIDSIWFGTDESKKVIPAVSTLSGKKGKLSLATEAANAPFVYISNSNIVGYEIDIAYRFCKEYGYGLEMTDMNFDGIIPAVSSGKNDFGCATITITEERRESVNFSEPHYDGGSVLAVRASDISSGKPASVTTKTLSYSDYNGKKIGILTGTNMEAESFKYFPDSEYLYFDGYPNLNTALINGAIDAYLADEPAVRCIHAAQPSIDYIKGRLTDNNYSFAFRKNEESETKLRDQLNEFLSKCRSDGTLAEIDSIWFGSDDSKKLVDMSGLTGENGTIHVVTTSTDEPFSYIKNGAHVGYDIDVTVRFCREYGYALEIGDVDFQARIPALASGKYEFTTSMNVTPEREEEVMFSDPVSSGGIVVAVRASDLAGTESAPQTVEDRTLGYYAANGKIGAITGGLYEVMIRERYPEAEILQFNSQPDLAIALSEGKIDAFTCPKSSAEDFMAADSSLTYLKEIFMEIPYGFAFKKSGGENKLRDQMNEYLAKIRADGTYEEIVATWFGSDESKKTIDYTGLDSAETTLRYITASTMQPYSYIKDRQNAGLEADIVARFCREYGYGLRIDNADFAGLIPGIAGGTYDIASGTIMITEERAQSVDFSDVYYTGEAVSVVRKEGTSADTSASPAEPSYTEFNGRRLGIKPGSSFEPITLEYFPDSEHFYFDSTSDLIAALQNDKIDCFLADKPDAEMIHVEHSDVCYLKKPLKNDDYHFLFQKNTERSIKLRTEFNELIAELRSNGQLDALKEKWVSIDGSEKTVDRSGLTGENGEITVAVNPDGIPFSYISNNDLVGYAVELTTLFAGKYGYSINYEYTNLTGGIAGLTSGKYDMLAGSYSYTEERAESMDYSDAIYNGGIMVMLRASDLGGAASADGSSSAVEENSSFFGSIKESFNKNFIREDRYKLILEGIGMTCMITVLSVAFGSVLAFLICMFRRADSLLAGKICDLYVKLLQGTPMVVLLMILYYVVFGKSGMAAMWVAVIGFSLNFGAYVSEILRSGIESIDGGQREAALALGYSENQAFFRFIFPQAAVRQLPVYRGEIISLLKNTSIVGYIAIQDLTKMSDIIRSRTYEAFFPLIVTAVIYFFLAWIISLILKLVLKRIDPRSKKRGVKGVAVK